MLVGVLGLGTAFVGVGSGGAALTATTVPNPDPPPVPPPVPPPPAYVPPPPPPPAYVPPPPPPAYVPPRTHPTKAKPHAVKRAPAAKKKHRLVLAPPRRDATPHTPSAATVGAVHASGVAASDTSSRRVLPVLFAGAVGLALLLLMLLFVPAFALGPRLGAAVDARRESLILGAVVCVVGIALGVLIALIGL